MLCAMRIKFYFSRLIAFVSPRLWRKVFCKPSHWEDRDAQERLFRYVCSGVNVRLRRSDSFSVSALRRAIALQNFARSIHDHRSVLDFVFPRPMAEDENF